MVLITRACDKYIKSVFLSYLNHILKIESILDEPLAWMFLHKIMLQCITNYQDKVQDLRSDHFYCFSRVFSVLKPRFKHVVIQSNINYGHVFTR